jgi:hypothetical protein
MPAPVPGPRLFPLRDAAHAGHPRRWRFCWKLGNCEHSSQLRRLLNSCRCAGWAFPASQSTKGRMTMKRVLALIAVVSVMLGVGTVPARLASAAPSSSSGPGPWRTGVGFILAQGDGASLPNLFPACATVVCHGPGSVRMCLVDSGGGSKCIDLPKGGSGFACPGPGDSVTFEGLGPGPAVVVATL